MGWATPLEADLISSFPETNLGRGGRLAGYNCFPDTQDCHSMCLWVAQGGAESKAFWGIEGLVFSELDISRMDKGTDLKNLPLLLSQPVNARALLGGSSQPTSIVPVSVRTTNTEELDR